MTISSIELALTKNVRRFLFKHISIKNLRFYSFIVALSSCVCSGSVLLFSMFTPSLQKNLSYTQLQINTITSLSAVGMYLFLPLLGYLADCHGPVLLAVLSMIMFCPGYYIAAFAVQNQLSYWVMAISFMFIGCATSSLYFSSLLTCAKIYPEYKGLSISAPVTCYGLSSLIGAQLLSLNYFKVHDHFNDKVEADLDLYRIFSFFAVVYCITGIFNWVASSIVSIESDLIYSTSTSARTNEESPLLQEIQDCDNVGDIDPPDHKERFVCFLRDRSAWFLLISLFLNIGPLEMFNNNMGSLIKTVGSGAPSISSQVSVYATSSTLTRLFVGGLSDYLSQRFGFCRMWLLAIVIIFGFAGQFLTTFNIISINNGQYFPLVSILNGSSYGGLFSLYPTIVATVWGIDIMGSTWGSFMVAPALGSIIYSLLYGEEYDRSCSVASEGVFMRSFFQFTNCLSEFFALTSASFLVSLVIVILVWKTIWVKRGFSVF